jgi:hypothetical protein
MRSGPDIFFTNRRDADRVRTMKLKSTIFILLLASHAALAQPVTTKPNITNVLGVSRIAVVVYNIQFGTSNQTTTISFNLPAQFTAGNYAIASVRLSNASGTLTAATVCLSSATACGGTQYVASGTAVTVSTAAANTNNNSQNFTITNSGGTQNLNVNPLYFEVQTPSAASQTATLTLELQLES